MSQVQSGILPEHCRAAIWIEANVKGEVDALRAASKTFADKLATFEAKFPDANLGAVVAFGNNTWRALSGGVGAEELKDFPGYGKGLAPTTQFDVLIHILSLRHDVNFSVAQAAMEAFGDCIEVKEEIHGFRWVEERDLSGFVDGTENPAGEETRREVAVIKDGVDAGGSYVFADLTDNGNNLATINLSLEDFYAGAKDADVLLYNSTIEGSIASTEQLVEKCPLLAQFKAVQNGNVWCTAQSLFQQSMELPDLILDMNRVFTEGTPADSELTFLTHVE